MASESSPLYESDAMRAFAQANARRFKPGWILYVVIALLFGVYMGVNQFLDIGDNHFAAWKPFTWEISSVVVIFAMLPLVIRFEQRFPVDAPPFYKVLLVHLCGGVLFSLTHVAGMFVIRFGVYRLFNEYYSFRSVPRQILYELQKDLITYLVILVVIFAYRQLKVRRIGELRATQLQAELSEARLKHLTTQIEPHFLFNALNAISNRMHEDVDAADRMISDLGSLLRAAYDTDNQVLVPLSKELDWLKGYTAMMTERFRGQLEVSIEVAPDLNNPQVPRLLLQPLVENALRHGLAEGSGSLKIEVKADKGKLLYRVSDDGVGLKGEVRRGTGLSNIERRLELLFPGEHTFTITPREPKGTVAALTFPLTP
jgi:sensor histidine kinase YesM